MESSKTEIPSDSAFVQKANAIMKAAGLASNTMTIEQLRLGASVIFIRAYEAIYKTVITEKNIRPLTKIDHVKNAELLLKELKNNTNDPNLEKISGLSITDGDYNSIGIIVAILFAEGQRLWAERVKRKTLSLESQEEDSAQPKNLNIPERKLKKSELKKKHINEDEVKMKNQIPIDDNDVENIVSKFYDGPSIKVAPNELHSLIERIKYLENKLIESSNKKISRPKSAGKILSKPVSKVKFKREIPDPLFVNRENDYFEESKGLDSDSTSQLSQQNFKEKDMIAEKYKNQKKNQQTLDKENDAANAGGSLKKYKPVRPTSAPVRRFKQSEAADLLRSNSPKANQQNAPESPKKQIKKPSSGIPDNVIYDLNGRKVILSERELQILKQKQTMAAQPKDVGELTDPNPNKLGRRDRMMEQILNAKPISCTIIHPTPTTPVWPSARTERSAEEFVKKQKEARDIQNGIKQSIPPKVKMFGAYEKLQKLDLIFSIEYCHNCQYHNISLRHDPQEYKNNADTFLKLLSKFVYDERVCARVGVTRFEANVTPKSRQTDVDNRIGAFEIQVAYRNQSGQLFPDILHSKLAKRTWPSKSVVEKRLQSFFTRINALRINDNFDSETAQFEGTAEDGLAAYPVGFGPWSDTALSNEEWKFPGTSSVLDNDDPKQGGGESSSSNKIPNVQWVFDSRNTYSASRFTVGATILVSGFVNEKGVRERNDLFAVIKEIIPSSSRVGSTGSKKFIIKLKYQSTEIEALEENCKLLSESTFKAELLPTSNKIPTELELVIQSAKRLNILHWQIQFSEDKKESVNSVEKFFLSRSSFFNQIRAFAGAVEAEFKAKGGHKVLHSSSGNWVDVQLAYSETCLDQVFNLCGGKYADISLIETLIDEQSTVVPLDTSELKIDEPVNSQNNSLPTTARSSTFKTENLRYVEELPEYSNLYLSPSIDTPSDRPQSRPGTARSLNNNSSVQGDSPFQFLVDESGNDSFLNIEESADINSNSGYVNSETDRVDIFEDRNIHINQIEVEGELLSDSNFDNFLLILDFFNSSNQSEEFLFHSVKTPISSPSEARVTKRIFQTNFKEISLRSQDIMNGVLNVSSESYLDEDLEKSIFSGSIKLNKFMQEVGKSFDLELLLKNKEQKILVKICYTASLSDYEKANKIKSLKSTELSKYNVAPLSDEDETDEPNEESPIDSYQQLKFLNEQEKDNESEEEVGQPTLTRSTPRDIIGEKSVYMPLAPELNDSSLNESELEQFKISETIENSFIIDKSDDILGRSDSGLFEVNDISNAANISAEEVIVPKLIALSYDRNSRPSSAHPSSRPSSAAKSLKQITPREYSQDLLDQLNDELNGDYDDGYDYNDDFEEL